MISTKNDCPHKQCGQSTIIIYEQQGSKYLGKCLICSGKFKYKHFKQIPVDVQWDLGREE